MILAVYVSGHGFGHAVRVSAVLDEVLRRVPDVTIHVRTMAPARLFPRRVRHESAELDAGLAQTDALEFDLAASLERLDALERSRRRRLEEEARWLRGVGANLVLADIPPLAFAAARAAEIPSIALGNFSWDWIYASYADDHRRFAEHAARAAADYAAASLLLRLPFHGGGPAFAAFATIADVPLVVRRPSASRTEARRAFGLPPERPLALLSFGGAGVRDLPFDRLGAIREVDFVTTDRVASLPRNVLSVRSDGLDYTELVSCCDAVVTKPGYGIVASCLAFGVRVLYTSRGPFPEYPVLVEALERHGTAAFVAPEMLRSLDVASPLRDLLARPVRAADLATDGAGRVAAALLRWPKLPRSDRCTPGPSTERLR